MNTETKQQHHFFASTAFGWSVAPTRQEAIDNLARLAGAEQIKLQVKANGGLYVWSCKVLTPQDQNYTINWYMPDCLRDADDNVTTVKVPRSDAMAHNIVSVKGHLRLIEAE